MLSCALSPRSDHLIVSENPLFSFLALLSALFSHQGFEWFLFVLFLTVLAFTHVTRSLYLGLIGCAENNVIAYRSLPPQAPTPPH